MNKLDFYIVDDSEVNNYYTEDLLQEFDFTNSVRSFVKATDALENLFELIRANKKLPDAIFLDIRMPEMDGFEFIGELESKLDDSTLTTNIFILTSSKHRRDLEAFEKQLLASEFLNKPLDKVELHQVILKHFDT